MRVRQPAVHRRESDLGAVAEDEERHREAHDARIEMARGRHQRGPVEHSGSVRACERPCVPTGWSAAK